MRTKFYEWGIYIAVPLLILSTILCFAGILLLLMAKSIFYIDDALYILGAGCGGLIICRIMCAIALYQLKNDK